MANQRLRRKKKITSLKKKRGSKGNQYRKQLLKILTGIALLVALVVAAFGLTHHLLKRPVVSTGTPPLTIYNVPPEANLSKPTYEIFPKRDLPPATPIKPSDQQKKEFPFDRPKVAIIIDDLGYDAYIAQDLLELDGPLTFAMLPNAPFNDQIITAAHAEGFEIMLHLPMEPKEYPRVNPGPGALLTSMEPDHLIMQLTENIESIPHLKGINNHMGSKMTASSSQMRQIFTILKKRGLFFIDSRTSADTICRSSAKLLKIPFAERDVFIDHSLDPQFIRKQIKRLVQQARKNGQAVGIAHPHFITFDILRDVLPKLEKEIRLVPASEVVHQQK